MTYYTVFVIDLASRRVQIVGSPPHPDEPFMRQIGRMLTAADEGRLVGHRVLICDRDRKWNPAVRERLEASGGRVVQTPFQAPNANAYAERFVRSIKHKYSLAAPFLPVRKRAQGRRLPVGISKAMSLAGLLATDSDTRQRRVSVKRAATFRDDRVF